MVAVGLAIGVIANLPFRYIERGVRSRSIIAAQQRDYARTSLDNVIAGFPSEISRSVYNVSSESLDANERPKVRQLLSRRFSRLNLLCNIVFWAAAIGLALAIVFRPRPKTRDGRWHRLDESVLPLVILIVPSMWLGYHHLRLVRQERLVVQIIQTGTCELASYLPAWIADSLPKKLVECFRQISSVDIQRPDEELLRQIMDQPMLADLQISNRGPTSINFSVAQTDAEFLSQPRLRRSRLIASDAILIGGEATLKKLRLESQGNPLHLTDGLHANRNRTHPPDSIWWKFSHARPTVVSIDNCDQHPTLAQFLHSNPQILDLTIRDSTIDEATAASISALPNLRALSLVRTQLPATGLIEPAWKDCIKNLTLSINHYHREIVELRGYSQLEVLQFISSTTIPVEAKTEVQIVASKAIRKIKFDMVGRYDLKLQDLPLFKSIESIDPNEVFTDHPLAASDLGRFAKCIIQNCPELDNVCLMLTSVHQLDIGDSGGIQTLEFGGYSIDAIGSMISTPLQSLSAKQIIREITRCEEVQSLKVMGIDLSKHDISPLTEASQLRSLSLVGCLVSTEQVSELSACPSLEELDLAGVPIRTNQLPDLLRKFPNLKTLACDASQITNLSFDEDIRLQEFRTPPLSSIEHFSFTGQNELACGINLDHPLKTLRIQSARRLTGLAIGQPLPENTVIGELRDLEYFVGGGRNLDDTIWQQLRRCDQLQHLMIAYANLSRESLGEIGEFRSLHSLSVPGSKLDDEIVDQWSSLKHLWSVDFSRTAVGPRTMRWLSVQPSLRFLALDGVAIDDSILESLIALDQVTHLSLRDVKLTPDQFARVVGKPLEYLNISDRVLSDRDFEALVVNGNHKLLIAKDCGMTSKRILEILSRCPRLKLEVESELLDDQLRSLLGKEFIKRLVIDSEIFSQREIRANLRAQAFSESDEISDPNVASGDSETNKAAELLGELDSESQRFDVNLSGPGKVQSDGKLRQRINMEEVDAVSASTRRFALARENSIFLRQKQRTQRSLLVPPTSRLPPSEWLGGKADHFRDLADQRI